MGFTTGFTGGVTLTLSVAYLTVLAHQRNRQRQCDVLRANTTVLRALALADPITAARLATPHAAETPADLSAAAAAQEFYYPSKADTPRQPRSSFVEELKTRWNAEVEGAVRKVQTTDWVEVRENAEGRLGQIWRQTFGGEEAAATAAAATAAVKERAVAVTESVKAEAKDIQATAIAQANEAAAVAKKAASRAVDKGREVLAAETSKAQTAAAQAAGQLSEVELALQQRYTGAAEDVRMKKSVGELLDERYKQTA
ncbi:hypothetical protein HMPREF1624_00115 [Sporothrix schenckii ATCC 58251]|uniref:MICOS complex subunit MIC12 n=1 Tax=Sporothrix schenckii (strain ATCC 58251 / de Perez 2211183) TaxID=1391915 RepID=U7Q522_SPOS1|nr:hypothetical protein HMPREF1624_00115 [Sporothrix schenckii ATCC 58251]